jgi:hypothetical protein
LRSTAIFLGSDSQVAAHFLGRRATVWQLGQDIRQRIFDPPRDQLRARAGRRSVSINNWDSRTRSPLCCAACSAS